MGKRIRKPFPSTPKGRRFAQRLLKTSSDRAAANGATAREREKLRLEAIAREAIDPEFKALRDRWRAGQSLGEINQKDRERCHRRRARFRGSRYLGVSVQAWETIRQAYTDSHGRPVCCYCERPCKHTIDHLVPLSRGGPHRPDNIVPACHSCNASKRNRLVSEWPRATLLLSPIRYAELVARSDALIALSGSQAYVGSIANQA